MAKTSPRRKEPLARALDQLVAAQIQDLVRIIVNRLMPIGWPYRPEIRLITSAVPATRERAAQDITVNLTEEDDTDATIGEPGAAAPRAPSRSVYHIDLDQFRHRFVTSQRAIHA